MLQRRHPSDRLAAGEAGDFHTAMELALEACAYELEHAGEEGMDGIKAYRQAANEAVRVYYHQIEEAEKRVVAELRASGNEDLQRIAEALESGDYTMLAF